MEKINSKDNETFKKIKKLKTKKYREQEQLYLAEGRKFLDFIEVPEIIIYKEDISEELLQKGEKYDCRKIILPEKLFKEISSQENSQGIIICYKIKKGNLDKISDNIIILNNVADPGNLGTIIRIADAAGFNDIILTKGSADCYNEKTVRSTMGSIFNMNILYLEESDLISTLKEKEYKIFATTLEKDSIEYTDMKLESKNAFIFGNEGNGITREIIDISDEKIIIPIYGIAESLNVAMASGIILYEVRNKLK